MTDILKKNFEKFRNEDYKEFLDKLEETFSKFGIDFYLIGATSRDLWINGIDSIPLARATYDLDFAIYINDSNEYESIKDILSSKGFERTTHPYRMNYGGLIIDLLPFGKIEVNRTVELLAHPPVTLSVLGFKEVYEHAFEASEGFKLAPLHGICVLKLASFSERPERIKDKEDFEYILENYFEINSIEILENYTELIAEYNDEKIAGAIVLGKKMKEILVDNTELKKSVLEGLKNLLPKFEYDEIDEMYEYDKEDKQIKKFKLILEIIREVEK